MAKRILSTLALWSLLFAVLWLFRTTGAVVLITLAAVLTLREFYELQAAAGRAPFARLGMFFGALIAAAPWLQFKLGWPAERLLPLAVVVFSVRILGERAGEKRADSLASTLFGLVYVALMLQFFVRIATPQPGDAISADGRLLLCVWLVVVAKLCDSGALLTGLAAGRHPLAPHISPKKTWEGAIGGVLTAMLAGTLFAWFARGELGPYLSPPRAALAAVPVAVVAIVSDLIESVLKRQADIKDSGRAVPGIGGVFDVTDSLLLAAPIGYVLFGFR